jgi:hypothetical protein
VLALASADSHRVHIRVRGQEPPSRIRHSGRRGPRRTRLSVRDELLDAIGHGVGDLEHREVAAGFEVLNVESLMSGGEAALRVEVGRIARLSVEVERRRGRVEGVSALKHDSIGDHEPALSGADRAWEWTRYPDTPIGAGDSAVDLAIDGSWASTVLMPAVVRCRR